jgi:bacitracin synthase 1
MRPDAEAVVFKNDRLTYRQLDRKSNQVAQFLVQEGICPEDRVGIFMNRSADMIVAMLGILKAGGAYVPIDPDYRRSGSSSLPKTRPCAGFLRSMR